MTSKKELKARLNRMFKSRGTISDRDMERLEDKYGVDLTSEYGEYDKKVVEKIMRKIR